MNNWEEIHECEDARDLERLKRRDQTTKDGKLVLSTLGDFEGEPLNSDLSSMSGINAAKNFKVQQHLLTLYGSGWFSAPDTVTPFGDTNHHIQHMTNMGHISRDAVQAWKKEIKEQEMLVRVNRHNALELQNQMHSLQEIQHSLFSPEFIQDYFTEVIPDTISNVNGLNSLMIENPSVAVQFIGHQNNLNFMQDFAYKIVCEEFLKLAGTHQSAEDQRTSNSGLRLLLHGPGGTGKTHVVKSVKDLMSVYNKQHCIRFLAPTGSAAALIDGMTCHKGLGLTISSNKGNSSFQLSKIDEMNVVVTIKEKSEIRG